MHSISLFKPNAFLPLIFLVHTVSMHLRATSYLGFGAIFLSVCYSPVILALASLCLAILSSTELPDHVLNDALTACVFESVLEGNLLSLYTYEQQMEWPKC